MCEHNLSALMLDSFQYKKNPVSNPVDENIKCFMMFLA